MWKGESLKTLAEIKKERLDTLRSLKPVARKADGFMEKFERELNRLTKRKRAVPEYDDLKRLVRILEQLLMQLAVLESRLQKGYIE